VSSLTVSEVQGQLVVDSRLVATELGIEHATLLKTIKKYLTRLERKEPARFQIDVVKRPQGGTFEETYCYLTESQATLLMTFSRNTDQVLDCKERLVDAFSKAKQIIKEVIPQQIDRIRELELELQLVTMNRSLEEVRFNNNRLACDMATMHGQQFTLTVLGRGDQVVEVEKPIIEVLDKSCGDKRRGMTAVQMNNYLKQKTGNGFKSGAALVRALEKLAPELVDLIQRPINQEFIHEDNIDAAFKILSRGEQKQLRIGEV